MKKILSVLLSLVLLLTMVCNAFAADIPNRIYADAVTVEAGEQVTIPVKIKNNDGFMGFAIIADYNAEVFTPVSVSKGTMLTGMFNDSIETSTDNSFKVIFTGTGDIAGDGELFNIVFDVSDSASGEYEIALSYSQQDTFKEDWTNAEFSCESITVTVTDDDAGSEQDKKPSTEPQEQEKKLSVRMREWVSTLPSVLSILVGIIVIPVSYIVAIFE